MLSVAIARRFVDAGSQEAYWRLVVDSVLLETNLSGCQVINVSHSIPSSSWYYGELYLLDCTSVRSQLTTKCNL